MGRLANQQSERFRVVVLKYLESADMTIRGAARKIKELGVEPTVSNSTINEWANEGTVPQSSYMLRTFADALDLPRWELLDAADYKVRAEDYENDRTKYGIAPSFIAQRRYSEFAEVLEGGDSGVALYDQTNSQGGGVEMSLGVAFDADRTIRIKQDIGKRGKAGDLIMYRVTDHPAFGEIVVAELPEGDQSRLICQRYLSAAWCEDDHKTHHCFDEGVDATEVRFLGVAIPQKYVLSALE